MKIAGNEIKIQIDDEEIILVPRLRYAIHLAGRTGGLQKMARDISDLSVTAMADCVYPHCEFSREFIVEGMLLSDLTPLRNLCLSYIAQLVAFDPQDEPDINDKPSGNPKGKQQPYPDFFNQLYRYGTGWLGWTPEETLDATPFEIIEAHAGRMQMLKAIFGGNDKQAQTDDRPLNDKFRSIFAGLGTTKE